MDGRGLQVEELGGWRWWWERKGGGDGRKQESAATQAWWTVNEPGVTCLHSAASPPAQESKINLLTQHFCGLCYYYLLWLPCLCVTAQLLPYMELICHDTVKAGFVAGLYFSLLMVIESSEYKRGKNRHPLLKDKPA